jgi:hypothetical protein
LIDIPSWVFIEQPLEQLPISYIEHPLIYCMSNLIGSKMIFRHKPFLWFFMFLLGAIELQAQITTIQIEGIGDQNNIPITFGQPLKKGDLPSGATLMAKNSAGNAVAIQVDKKASFSDGSIRHVIISGKLRDSEDAELNLFVQPDEGVSSSETTITLVVMQTIFTDNQRFKVCSHEPNIT